MSCFVEVNVFGIQFIITICSKVKKREELFRAPWRPCTFYFFCAKLFFIYITSYIFFNSRSKIKSSVLPHMWAVLFRSKDILSFLKNLSFQCAGKKLIFPKSKRESWDFCHWIDHKKTFTYHNKYFSLTKTVF